MNTAVWLGLSALIWGVGLIYFAHVEVGLVIVALHAVVWQNHRLEVKVNRLLSEQNITVTDAELRQ